MKILIDLFEMLDYGGIVQCCELTYEGLREMGHDVDFVVLRPNDRDPYVRKSTGPAGSYPSVMGGEVNTISGWYGCKVMSYGSAARVRRYRWFMEEHDFVIHMTPVPKPDSAGLWKKIYAAAVPQIAWIHDANFPDMYPHLELVADRLNSVIVSNQAGFAATKHLSTMRHFTGTPKKIADEPRMWKRRPKRAVCAHVWKAWKRMHLAVEAYPHLSDPSLLVMGGDGIEGRYMRSKDKCKPRYEGIWRRALKAGMEYRGLMTHHETVELMSSSRAMIDLSYSRRFHEKIGGAHWNSSLLDAYNVGCIPILTRENMVTSAYSEAKVLWRAGVNYVPIDAGASPKDLATLIEEVVNMANWEAEEFVAEGRNLVRHFDYRKFAADVIAAATTDKSVGLYSARGVTDPEFMKIARKHAKAA